jgi:hypothetical protein
MSVKLMSMVYSAHFQDITFLHKGKKKTGEVYEKIIKVMNFNLKSVCLALADHANDEGEGAYPAVETLASKTELSDVTVIACLRAMKQEGVISYTGRSKWDTCNYTIKKDKLAEMETWERQKRDKVKSKAALLSNIKPLYSAGKATLPKPSLNHPSTKKSIKRPDFKSLSPEKYRTIPELKTFMDATGWIPGSFVLEVVYDFVNKGLTREQINAAFSEWTSRGYKPANVKGYLTWARDGIPVERQYNQTPAQKTTNFDRTVAGLQKFMANHPEEAYGNS